MAEEPFVERVRGRLRSVSDPEFRDGQQRFFKHEVDTWGVRGPELKAIAREVFRDIRSWPLARRNRVCEEFWRGGKLEEGGLVCYVYRRFKKECGRCEFRLFERWIERYVENWATCDGVASWLLAASIANEPELIEELPPWTTSPKRWKRRAAAVALLQEAKRGRNTQAIFNIAGRLMTDQDDMVQKGVGWLLKETYPKRPGEVVAFLEAWRGRTSRLLLRYAAEKMTAEDRAIVLLKPDLQQEGGEGTSIRRRGKGPIG